MIPGVFYGVKNDETRVKNEIFPFMGANAHLKEQPDIGFWFKYKRLRAKTEPIDIEQEKITASESFLVDSASSDEYFKRIHLFFVFLRN